MTVYRKQSAATFALLIIVLLVSFVYRDTGTAEAHVQSQVITCQLPPEIASHLSSVLYWTVNGRHYQQESFDQLTYWYAFSGKATHGGVYAGAVLNAAKRMATEIDDEVWAACGLTVRCPATPFTKVYGFCRNY